MKQDISDELLKKVLSYITEHRMFRSGGKAVVAVSGEPDSVALLDILNLLKGELGISLHVAHLDHMIRGEESREDADFVRLLAEKIGLHYTIGKRDVPALASRQKLSLEDAARKARYDFLEEVAAQVKADRVATGHTLNDQAETFLLRLLRGSGTRGLSGIPPVRDGFFVRPLLSTSRDEVEKYLHRYGIPFREDSSNRDLFYTRNRVRWELLPMLESYNPNIVSTLARAADIIRNQEQYISLRANEALHRVLETEKPWRITLRRDEVLEYHVSVQRSIVIQSFVRLSGNALRFEDVARALNKIEEGSGFVSLPGQVKVQVYGNSIIFKKGKVEPFEVEVPLEGKVEIPEISALVQTRVLNAGEAFPLLDTGSPYLRFFDLAAISGRIFLRSRIPGDFIVPFGMEGRKKVKDILIDDKIPRILRDEAPILSDNEKVIWLVGLVTSDLCRVSPGTEKVLEVKFSEL